MRRDEIFERLDPPPGGLAALRARISPTPRRARRLALLAFAVGAATILFVLSRGRAPDPVEAARRRGDAPQIALGLAPMPATAAAIDQEDRGTTALAAVPTKDPHVSFYWVSSTTWQD